MNTPIQTWGKGSSIGVGLVGTGDIAPIYLKNLPTFEGLRLVACTGRNADIVAAKAAAFGIEAISLDEMLRRPDIGIIVNLTPPAAHADITSAALSAGKHVYSEKPLAANAADGRRLVREARGRGLALGCAPDTFLGAAGRAARSIVDGGHIGRILSGTCMFMSHGMEHRHPNPEFFFKPGGGPVFDIGPYYLTMLVNLLGPVAQVQARASRGSKERVVTARGGQFGQRIEVETPTTVLAILSFRSGADISFTVSWDVWRHGHSPIELYGSEGSLKLADPDTFGGALAFAERGGEWQPIDCSNLPFGHPNWRSPAVARDKPLSANYRGIGVADMASHILNGTPHRSSVALASHVLDVMEAILQAAEEGQTVGVPSSVERPAAMSDDDAQALQKTRIDSRRYMNEYPNPSI